MRDLAGRPPPLTPGHRPVSVRLRITLWRCRYLVAAICLGIAASATVHALRPPDAPTVAVVVAARAVEAGVALTASDIRIARYPVAGVPDGAVRGPSGTVVATVRFADPAVAGLLAPGMHVDILAATAEGGPGGVVARRALVLPTARRSPAAGGLLGGSPTDDDSVPVLVAVSPEEAPALAGAAASALLSAVVVP